MSSPRRQSYRRLRACSAFGLVAVLLACEGEPSPPTFTTRDSAGWTVAVSTEAEWRSASPWVLSAEPLLDLAVTGRGPEHEFFRVTGAVRLADGRIVVANAGSHEVRSYSSDGAFLTAVGREGDGPGEFRNITEVDRYAGDSVIVFSRPGRATVVDSDLRFGRTLDFQGVWQRARGQADGTLLITRAPSPFEDLSEAGGVIRLIAPVVRLDRDGHEIDTVATIGGYEQVLVPRGEGVISASLLYGKTLVFAASDAVAVSGDAERMAFDVIDLRTGRGTVVRVPDFDLSVIPSDRARQEEAYLGPEPSATRRLVLESMPSRATRPAYTEVDGQPRGAAEPHAARGGGGLRTRGMDGRLRRRARTDAFPHSLIRPTV